MNLAHALKATNSSTNHEPTDEAARWLGRVVGYYAGPGSDQMKPEEFSAWDADVSSSLEGECAKTYSEAKAAVTTKYKHLRETLADERRNINDENESKLAIDCNRNAAALKIVARHKNEAIVSLQQVEQSVAQVNRGLIAQGSSLEKKLNSTKADKRQLENDDDKGNNKPKIDEDEKEITRLQNLLTPIKNQLKANEDAVNAAGQTVRRLSKAEDDLSAKHKELERKLDKPVPDKDSTTAALEQKMKSVSTYVSINLPRERQRILDSFRDQKIVPNEK